MILWEQELQTTKTNDEIKELLQKALKKLMPSTGEALLARKRSVTFEGMRLTVKEAMALTELIKFLIKDLDN